jgi:hypothetical protein
MGVGVGVGVGVGDGLGDGVGLVDVGLGGVGLAVGDVLLALVGVGCGGEAQPIIRRLAVAPIATSCAKEALITIEVYAS